MMKNLLVLCLATVCLSGCALLLTPEQREERRQAKAKAQHDEYVLKAANMNDIDLCYSVVVKSGTPKEFGDETKKRKLSCTSPEMINALSVRSAAEASQRQSDVESSKNLQQYSNQLLQSGKPRQPTNCYSYYPGQVSCY